MYGMVFSESVEPIRLFHPVNYPGESDGFDIDSNGTVNGGRAVQTGTKEFKLSL